MTLSLSVTVKDNQKGTVYDFDSDLDGRITMQQFANFIKNAQVNIARQVFREVVSDGFDPEARTRVDNVFDKPIESVRPFGKIEYYARQNITDAIVDAYRMVEDRSPVATGQYASSNYVFLNNKLVATNIGELKTWASKAEIGDSDFIRIVNVTPYASRLEIAGIKKGTRGKTKGISYKKGKSGKSRKTGLSFKKPNGVYVLAERAIRGKYKGIGAIKFSFMPNGTNGVYIKADGRFRNSYIADTGRRNKKKRFSGPYVYPSITFTLSGKGILQ